MARTNDALVKEVIDVDDTIWSSQFVSIASDMVADRLEGKGISEAILTHIETYLAAHFYALRDPQYESKRTDRAQAKFQGRTGMGLDGTWWGRAAKDLDPTGSLDKHELSIHFLGTEEDI